MERLHIDDELTIPLSALSFSFDRSPGPGGQHVNKVSTRVEVRLDVAHTPVLTPGQRCRLLAALSSRLTAAGELVVRSSRFRSQTQNRRDCIARLTDLLTQGLRPPPPKRHATRPTRASQRRRLDRKARRGEQKALRQRPPS